MRKKSAEEKTMKKILFVAIAIFLIGAAFILHRLFDPAEARAITCAPTCGQTYNAAMVSCRVQCGSSYPSSSSTLEARKSGCAFYMTTIDTCSGQVVNIN